MDIIVSVAAVNNNGDLGTFSNWGPKTVDLGAPGVNIFSTMVGNEYNNVIVDMLGKKITWDGTSMATPHVAGAAALYWSEHPENSWRDVKDAVLSSVRKTSNLSNKIRTGGRLDAAALMNQ